MILNDIDNDCPQCKGTGRVVNVSRGVARAWACRCPAGRALALTPAPVVSMAARSRRSAG